MNISLCAYFYNKSYQDASLRRTIRKKSLILNRRLFIVWIHSWIHLDHIFFDFKLSANRISSKTEKSKKKLFSIIAIFFIFTIFTLQKTKQKNTTKKPNFYNSFDIILRARISTVAAKFKNDSFIFPDRGIYVRDFIETFGSVHGR